MDNNVVDPLPAILGNELSSIGPGTRSSIIASLFSPPLVWLTNQECIKKNNCRRTPLSEANDGLLILSSALSLFLLFSVLLLPSSLLLLLLLLLSSFSPVLLVC